MHNPLFKKKKNVSNMRWCILYSVFCTIFFLECCCLQQILLHIAVKKGTTFATASSKMSLSQILRIVDFLEKKKKRKNKNPRDLYEFSNCCVSVSYEKIIKIKAVRYIIYTPFFVRCHFSQDFQLWPGGPIFSKKQRVIYVFTPHTMAKFINVSGKIAYSKKWYFWPIY